jgi:group I intron endonuclease
MKKIGIYKITNPKGAVYIGQSIDIYRRFRYYKKTQNCNEQPKLYNSFLKYGTDNHTFEIIEECSVEILNERERYWQDFYNATNRDKGLNCRLTETSDFNGKLSEETCEKISIALKGRVFSEEHKKKLAENHAFKKEGYIHPNKGKKHSSETIKKMSESNPKIRSKKVINTKTGEIYNSGKEMCEILGLNYNVMRKIFCGQVKNNTPFKYID